jgi:ketosteroid isomerase-like protein
MSGENIEVVRRCFAAFNDRDVAAALALLDPEVDLFAPGTGTANKRAYHHYAGSAGILLYFEDVERTWAELRVDVEDYRESGDRVVATGLIRARAKDGPSREQPIGWVWRLRDGVIVYGRVYDDPKAALETLDQ